MRISGYGHSIIIVSLCFVFFVHAAHAEDYTLSDSHYTSTDLSRNSHSSHYQYSINIPSYVIVARTSPPQPDFSISASDTSIQAGSSGTSTITISSTNAFNASVSLAVKSVGTSGIRVTFSQNPVMPGTSAMTIDVNQAVAAGTYAITITGTSGSLTHDTNMSLDVTSAPIPSGTNIIVSPRSGGSQSCASTNNCFTPNIYTVNVGDTVTWYNDDGVYHTVTSGNPSDSVTGDLFDSGMIKPRGQFSFTFTKAGTYDYFCQVHPWMTGQVVVTTPAPPAIYVQSDSRSYYQGEMTAIKAHSSNLPSGQNIVIRITDSSSNTISSKTIATDMRGYGTMTMKLSNDAKTGTYQITATTSYNGSQIKSSSQFTVSNRPTIELDQKVYTWTNRVYITVVDPGKNFDPNLIDTIGNNDENKVIVSTRGNQIYYKLAETGVDTGIFTGYVILTGDPNIKGAGGVDGAGSEPTGTLGNGASTCNSVSAACGPTDGFLPSEDSDGVSVSFEFASNQTVTGSALIRWNIGEIKWLQSSYPANGQGVLQVIDPDMNLNPKTIDKLDIKTWSESDPAGIKLTMTETGEDTGIFQGTLYFTTNFQSSSNRLHIAEGDTVTGEYNDKTLPPPYTPADQMSLTSTTSIGTNMTLPPQTNDIAVWMTNLQPVSSTRPGDSVQFDIRALNNGAIDTNAVVSIGLTPGLHFDPSHSDCTTINNEIRCFYKTVPHNSAKDMTLGVIVDSGASGIQTVTGTISSIMPDPDPSNNNAKYSFTVAAIPQDFTLYASAASVQAGSSGTSTITISPSNGFSSATSLSMSGAPLGIKGMFSPNPAAPETSTMIINVGQSVATGTYPITITGTSGPLSHSATLDLTVTAARKSPTKPEFTIKVTPASVTVNVGETATSEIVISSTGDVQSISLSCSTDIPSGKGSCQVTPSVLEHDNKGIITIYTDKTIPPKDYKISVTGSANYITHIIPIVLRVNYPIEKPSITISPGRDSFEMGSEVKFSASYDDQLSNAIDRFQWSFDDGSLETGPTSSHVFHSSGTHKVRLVAYYVDGSNAEITKDITVKEKPFLTTTQTIVVGSVSAAAAAGTSAYLKFRKPSNGDVVHKSQKPSFALDIEVRLEWQ